ncbi:MAG TPA: DUF2203 domain-containing protein [Polyangiaceae bacterium]|nr:DUF2203 domain-containing protein [Polyangiaceae bacterium]
MTPVTADARTVFTLEAVNALVPRLRALVGAQMERRSDIERRLEQLAELMGRSLETIRVDDLDPPDVRVLKRELLERIDAYRRGWGEIENMGAVLKDPRSGLVDFYGRVDGKLVWLCWKYGEEAVSHYHSLDEGFVGRKSIEPTMRHRHLN